MGRIAVRAAVAAFAAVRRADRCLRGGSPCPSVAGQDGGRLRLVGAGAPAACIGVLSAPNILADADAERVAAVVSVLGVLVAQLGGGSAGPGLAELAGSPVCYRNPI